MSEGPGLIEVNSELSQGFTEVLEDVSIEQQSWLAKEAKGRRTLWAAIISLLEMLTITEAFDDSSIGYKDFSWIVLKDLPVNFSTTTS